MGYKLTVNIKTRKGGEQVTNLLREYDYEHGVEYLYRRAINEICHYFNRSYFDQYEVWSGEDKARGAKYWRIQPKGSKYKGTIVIEKA